MFGDRSADFEAGRKEGTKVLDLVRGFPKDDPGVGLRRPLAGAYTLRFKGF